MQIHFVAEIVDGKIAIPEEYRSDFQDGTAVHVFVQTSHPAKLTNGPSI